jgi:hypothetical protein
MASFTLASTLKGDDNAWRGVGQPALKLLHSACSRRRLRSSWSDDGLHQSPCYCTDNCIRIHRALSPSLSPLPVVLCSPTHTHIHHGRNTHRYRRARPIANASLLTPRHSPRRRYRFPQGWFRWHGMPKRKTTSSMRTLLRQSPRTSPTTNTPP